MKQTTLSFLLIILFNNISTLIAQNIEIYTGKIIDAETKIPIPLVTIQSTSIYTITNLDGEFEIQPKQPDEQILFTHISYHPQQLSGTQLPGVIELKPKTFELAEVTITPRETLVKELKEVWNKYMALTKGKKDKDFPESTFYYRQLTSVDESYTEYIECFFTAPTTVSIQNMSLQEGRFAQIKKSAIPHITNYFYLSRIPPFSREKAQYKGALNTFLCEDFEDHYEIYLNRIISSKQEDEIKVYEFIPEHSILEKKAIFLTGKLFIRTKDHAIIRAEITPETMGITFGNKAKVLDEKHIFILTYRDGVTTYPIVESVHTTAKITISQKNEEKTMHINSILFANDYIFDKKGKKIKQKDFLLKEVINSKYNQEFWDNNPIVKRTRIEQQVLNDFNKEGYFGTMNMVQ